MSSSKHSAYRPPRNSERLSTMSTSSAPRSTTSRISASRAPSGPSPAGNAPATLATCTPVPLSCPSATGTSCGYRQTAATAGIDASRGLGRPAFAPPDLRSPHLSSPPRRPAAPPRALELPERHRHELRVEADGRDRRYRRVERVGPHRLRAHRHDLAHGIRALERREVHRADREVERPELGLPLDRALRERGGPLLESYRVHGRHARDQARSVLGHVQRQAGARAFDLCCLGHRTCNGTAEPSARRISARRRFPRILRRIDLKGEGMRKSVFMVVAVLALGLAACSSDDGGGETGVTGGETGAATGGTGATGGDCVDLTGEGAVFTITISDFAFVPNCFTASAAQGITVVNEDSADHTFTMVGTPINAPIAAGGTFSGDPITSVVAPGTYDLL